MNRTQIVAVSALTFLIAGSVGASLILSQDGQVRGRTGVTQTHVEEAVRSRVSEPEAGPISQSVTSASAPEPLPQNPNSLQQQMEMQFRMNAMVHLEQKKRELNELTSEILRLESNLQDIKRKNESEISKSPIRDLLVKTKEKDIGKRLTSLRERAATLSLEIADQTNLIQSRATN